MKEVRIPMDDDKHEDLTAAKNGRTWLEMLEKAAEIEEG